ncbi:hypothetical protein GWK47_015850 [Chionoecetes opilio]|uniref:Uncharacterized protein n=1 Tax=Chionoecetes opilio TaxID=41210 RepID=A0A8J4XS76_CHIOP|nr:hypothetical protein GWK47_015850 [Chionoecetes opilio]
MAYFGPGTLADVEADLALTDDDAMSEETWPPLAVHTRQGSTSAAAAATPGLPHGIVPSPITQASTSTKRPIDHASDTSGEPSFPAAKPSRRNETSFQHTVPDYSRPCLDPQRAPFQSAYVPPAFAPRTKYAKLLFRE